MSRQPHSLRQPNAHHLVVPAGDTLDADEIAGAKVFDPRVVEGSHSALPGCSGYQIFPSNFDKCQCGETALAFFSSATAMVIQHRAYHARETARLRLLAVTVKTPTERARYLEQAEAHAILAEFLVSESEEA